MYLSFVQPLYTVPGASQEYQNIHRGSRWCEKHTDLEFQFSTYFERKNSPILLWFHSTRGLNSHSASNLIWLHFKPTLSLLRFYFEPISLILLEMRSSPLLFAKNPMIFQLMHLEKLINSIKWNNNRMEGKLNWALLDGGEDVSCRGLNYYFCGRNKVEWK